MMRLCPKCGDYYADDPLAFCLVDGTPLVNVDLRSESWSEGARIIEGKKNALRKEKRRLKWRRILMTATTMLIATMVLCVVAINSFLYLKPKQEEVALSTPSTPTSTPTLTQTPPPTATSTLTPTPSPTPTLTPTPALVYKISGRVVKAGGTAIPGVKLSLSGSQSGTTTTDAGGNYSFINLPASGNYKVTLLKSNYSFTPLSRTINNLDANQTVNFTGVPVGYQISGRVTVNGEALGGVSITLSGSQSTTLTTDKNGNYAFSDVLAGGNYTITAASPKIVFKPPSRSINNLTQNESADFVGTAPREPPKCFVADKKREQSIIIERYGGEWRRIIESDRSKIIAENKPRGVANNNGRPGVANAEVTLGAIEYDSRFSQVCTAFVTARYMWQVRKNFNGKIEAAAITKEKRFACVKVGETWRCR